MAFCDLMPVEILDDAAKATYVIGEVFAVYRDLPVPEIFDWNQVQSVSEGKKTITIATEFKDFAISKKMFSSSEDYFRAIAIIECAQRDGGFTYEHHRRLLPLKSEYFETSPVRSAYRGVGKITKSDAVSAFIMLVNRKMKVILWLMAIMLTLILFLGLHFIFGITGEFFLYAVVLSVMGGGLIASIFYLICCLITANQYTSIAGRDPASRELITFVISSRGFAACESCIFDDRELIPWDSFDSFIESDKMFVLFKDDIASVFIPKKAFDRKCIGGISEIISHRLEKKYRRDEK